MLDWERVEFSISKDGTSVSASVPSQYFDQKILPLIETLLDQVAQPETHSNAKTSGPVEPVRPDISWSVRKIAGRLAARTASDVMKAAAISLVLVHGKEQFSYEELLAELHLATGYWKKTYAQGVSGILDWLKSSGFLVETMDGHLSLSPEAEVTAAHMLDMDLE
jgi:hypothetical protein